MIKASRALLVLSFAMFANVSQATIVRFEILLDGTPRNIDINLYDERTPLTVTNFLSYVNSGDYDGTMFHRLSDGFVLQGGGFSYQLDQNSDPLIRSVPSQPPVTNEPFLSNVRGTIAMAKLGGDPDSATSQWFFNLSNNAANLDNQNGGFTVFGEVIAGMDVVDQIAQLPIFGLVGAFSNSSALGGVPLQSYTVDDLNAQTLPDASNFISLTDVRVVDSALDTAASLNPPGTTRSAPIEGPGGSSGGGGGPVSLILILVFGMLTIFRRVIPAFWLK